MAIFSRRDIQAALNYFSGLVSQRQLAELVNRLNETDPQDIGVASKLVPRLAWQSSTSSKLSITANASIAPSTIFARLTSKPKTINQCPTKLLCPLFRSKPKGSKLVGTLSTASHLFPNAIRETKTGRDAFHSVPPLSQRHS